MVTLLVNSLPLNSFFPYHVDKTWLNLLNLKQFWLAHPKYGIVENNLLEIITNSRNSPVLLLSFTTTFTVGFQLDHPRVLTREADNTIDVNDRVAITSCCHHSPQPAWPPSVTSSCCLETNKHSPGQHVRWRQKINGDIHLYYSCTPPALATFSFHSSSSTEPDYETTI